MEDILNLEILVMITSWFSGLSVIAALALPLLNRDTTSSRLRGISMRREELQRQQKERIAKQKTARFPSSQKVSFMKTVLEKLKMQNQHQMDEIREKLMQAGMRGQSSVITFMFMRLMVPAGFVLFLMLVLKTSFIVKLMLMAAAGAVGYLLPGIMISNKIAKRQQALRRSFPDAVDLLLICVEAGLSVEAAFARVTGDLMDSAPVLAEEIGLTSAELAFLPERRQAYENLVKRTGLPNAKSLATALIQSEKYGTPVAVALRVVSQESRDSRMAAAEKKAGSLPAKLTVPMIVFFLPVLFVVILGPAVIKVIDQVFG